MSIRNPRFNLDKSKLSGAAALETRPWRRNPAWPELIPPSDTEEKVIGLVAVFPGFGTFANGNGTLFYTECATILNDARSDHFIDFGDGSNATVTWAIDSNYQEHRYNFSSASLYDATVAFQNTGDLAIRSNHGYFHGDVLYFYRIAGTSEIEEDIPYYVINVTQNSFQVSLQENGAAVAFTADGSASLLPYKIATVTITPVAGATFTDLVIGWGGSDPNTWLDIAISAPTAGFLYLQYSYMLEILNIVSIGEIQKSTRNDVDNRTSLGGFFGCSSLRKASINFNPALSGLAKSFGGLFDLCSFLKDVSLLNTSNVSETWSMFSECRSLEAAPYFDTSSVLLANNMFNECVILKTIPPYDFSNCTRFDSMFAACQVLEMAPYFNTESAVDMQSMFNYCTALTYVPLYNTSSVTNMFGMFGYCYALTDIPLLDTSSVTNMNQMFVFCTGLTTIPKLNTSSVTDMSDCFGACTRLKRTPELDVTSLQDALGMFSGCTSLKKVSLLNANSLTAANNMFINCYSLLEVDPINFSLVINSTNPFANCSSLQRMQVTGITFSFNITNCNLSGEALNEIYSNLGVVSGKTISVGGNPGTSFDDPSIATAKGWTVIG